MRFNDLLVAPCGINCDFCYRRLKTKEKCSGCRGSDDDKTKTIINCKIRTCDNLVKGSFIFCYECSDYPCSDLKKLNKRYEDKYNISLIGNLDYIEQNGLRDFLKFDKKRFTCEKCGETICIHDIACKRCEEKQ